MKNYKVVYLIIESIEAEDDEDAFQAFLEMLKDGDLEPTRRDLQIEERKGEKPC